MVVREVVSLPRDSDSVVVGLSVEVPNGARFWGEEEGGDEGRGGMEERGWKEGGGRE